ncbi:hypothetical protein AB8A21_16435 [Streptomyces sp. BF23-18]|uniref:hypothetical protein n=1 Tax=Streptomyces sp. BF23-18 TaxID=3240282 RepID=UPI0034E4D157
MLTLKAGVRVMSAAAPATAEAAAPRAPAADRPVVPISRTADALGERHQLRGIRACFP